MAQIMEFLLNLLLFRGKYLSATAAETLHQAFVKCLQFKRKIAVDYKTAAQVIGPFENMMEFINYNASQYSCEGNNYVVKSEIHYQLFENVNKNRGLKQNFSTSASENAKQSGSSKEQNFDKLDSEQILRHEKKIVHNKNKSPNQDQLVRNLHEILKSQEFLFKSIIKLVNLLEKDEILPTNSEKLGKIKRKLTACTDILTNTTRPQKFSKIINDIIEEEITRCRFRHGEAKTSAEIDLKVPRPEGIGAALETSRRTTKEHKTKKEKNKVKPLEEKHRVKSTNSLERSKSEPVLGKNNFVSTKDPESVLKQIEMDIIGTEKLIQINQENFDKFEENLWHSLTTMKFMDLKDDYLNMCKCAFYNRRQFMATESTLSKKLQQELEAEEYQKFMDISDSMLQMIEKKLWLDEVQKRTMIDQLPIKIDKKNEEKEEAGELSEKNPFLKVLRGDFPQSDARLTQSKNLKPTQKEEKKNPFNVEDRKTNEQKTNTIIEGKEIDKFTQNYSEEITVAFVKKDKTIVESRQSIQTTKVDQATNTIINGNNLRKHEENFNKMMEANGKDPSDQSKSTNEDVKKEEVQKDDSGPTGNFIDKIIENVASEETLKISKDKKKIGPLVKDEDVNENLPPNAEIHDNLSETPTPSEEVTILEKDILGEKPEKKTFEELTEKDLLLNRKESFDFTTNRPNKRNEKFIDVGSKSIPKNPGKPLFPSSSLIISSNEKQKLQIINIESFPVVACKNVKTKGANQDQCENVLKLDVIKDTLNPIEKAHMKIPNNCTPKLKESKNIDVNFKALAAKVEVECKGRPIKQMEKCKPNNKILNNIENLREDSQMLYRQKFRAQNSNLQINVGDERNQLVVLRNKEKRSVSLQELKNEAKLIQENEKAFKELESTIRTVKFFDNKTSIKSRTGPKSSSETNKKRQIDETPKKNMCTKYMTKQTITKASGDECDKNEKQKYIRPNKCKTFLKRISNSNLRKGENFHSQLENKSSNESLIEIVDDETSNWQMRRTTKNAIKRQGLPKVEKKKSQCQKPSVEKVINKKNSENKFVSKRKSSFTNVARKIPQKRVLQSSLSNTIPNNAPSKKITCVNWEEEDTVKIVSIFRY